MSRLYVSADSDSVKTLRTARGHRRVSAHPRGWNTGARATVTGAGDGPVSVYVERTAGSREADTPRPVAGWEEGESAVRFYARPGDILTTPAGEFFVRPDGEILRLPQPAPPTA